MSEEITMAVVELEEEKVMNAVKSRLERREDPIQILEACRRGMTIVGERFQTGDHFLAELMLSADIFKRAMAILEPHLAKARPLKPLGKMVLATPKGDIHDLGKNLVATLLRAHGFEVYDLGVDVDPALIVDKVKETKPQFVGFSALITSAFDSMKEAVDMLVTDGLRDQFKLMVGGGVTTPAVKDYIRADFQTCDAMEGVAYCTRVIGG